MSSYVVVAFYKFIEIPNLLSLQSSLKQLCREQNIFGTFILAKEGINATIAGKSENIKEILSFLKANPLFQDLYCKYSYPDFIPFHKMKVSIKKEIITLKIPNINPIQKTGEQISPEKWNNLISMSNTLVIDTRNTYEVELGSFKGAINPKTRKFSDFPAFVEKNLDPNQHQNIALFCTGGIRCEKASSYLLQQGFKNVYQLEGGILKYLEHIPPQDSLWEGKCFIFDNRITIDFN